MRFSTLKSLLAKSSVRDDFNDVKTLLIRYLKEETVDPIKSVGRFALFGTIGSLFVGLGVVFFLIGALRYLQWQFHVLDGSLSWIPYLAIVVVGLAVIALVVSRISSGASRRRSGAE
jgi:hypothetical protein